MSREKQKTFEEALLRLEEIIESLEDGKTPLDDSLKYYEEGIGLVKYCTGKLDSAEQKIKKLVKNQEGGYDEQDITEIK